MFTHSRDVEIEFGDCDPAGIVYYPNYFRMFDASTAHLFEAALGMKKRQFVEKFGILGIPMVDTGAQFSKPSRYGRVQTDKLFCCPHPFQRRRRGDRGA
jgi:4-hydroxybenzoyl-CoA thioesterase